MHRDEARRAAALVIGAPDQVTRALGGDHGHVHALGGLDEAVPDVEAVPEEEGVALDQVRSHVVGVEMTLDVVRRQDHGQVGLFDGLRG